MAGDALAVVFDFDGVIVESEHIGIELDRRLLARHGVHWSADEVADYFVGASEEFHDAELLRLVGGEPGLPAELAGQYSADYEELFAQVRPTEGIEALLEALARLALPLAIASNNDGDRIRGALARLGLAVRFGGRIAARESVARGKPAPDVYLRAASLLGIPPERCAAVEDSLPGIASARAAGMRVYGLVNRWTPEERIVAAGARPLQRLEALAEALGAAS